MSTPSQLPADYHTHNLLCKHAQHRCPDYARHGAHRGLPEMACTDHCPTDDGFGIDHRMELSQFPAYRSMVQEASETEGIKVLYGVEADYYPGCEKFLGPFLEKEPFDVVLGSVHFLDYWDFGRPEKRGLWDGVDITGAWKRYFELIMELVNTGLYDLASHLDLPKKFGKRPPDAAVREMVLPVFDRMAETGMGLEINTSGALVPCAEFYPSAEILSWAAERELPLSFGSDAHVPDRVGDGFEDAVQLAWEVGFTRCVRMDKRQKKLVPLPAIT